MSGIYLKPLEGGDSVEIPLDETVTIGRGPFLKITDKRVSRGHATVEVNPQGKLVLTPKHTNPCFFKAGGLGKYEILPKDQSKRLEHKDVFSLLADELAFEVIYSNPKNGVKQENTTQEEETYQNELKSTQGTNQKKTVKVKKKEMAMPLDKKRVLPKWMIGAAARTAAGPSQSTSKGPHKPRVAKNVRPPRQREVPSSEDEEEEPTPIKKKQKVHKSDEDAPVTKHRRAAARQPSYRDSPDIDLSLSEEEVLPSKKRKKDDSDFEPDDSGSDWGSKRKKGKGPSPKKGRGRPRGRSKRKQYDSEEVSEDDLDDYVPRPSKRRAQKDTVKHAKEESDPSESEEDEPKRKPETKKRKARREPCMYGKKCYRKNPEHFKEYSHPGDDSYEEQEESEEEKPKKTRRPARTKDKKSVLAGTSDDDGQANTYDYDDSFIDNVDQSDGSTSTYNEDSEDSNWEPEEEDDVKGLVKEARGFIKNKKLVKPAKSK